MDGLLIDPSAKTQDGPAWLTLALKAGIPALIAVYLVWNLSSGNQTLLAQIDRTQHQHTTDTQVQTEMLKILIDSAMRTEGYNRLICYNTSKTDVDRAACLTVR